MAALFTFPQHPLAWDWHTQLELEERQPQMEFVHLIVPYYHRSDSCTVVLVQNCALKFLRSRPKSRFGAESPDSKCALRVCPRGPSENSHFHELCPVSDVPLGPKPRYACAIS